MNFILNKRIIKIFKLSKQEFGRYKGKIALLTSLSFISGIFEGVGINALIPLFSFVTGGSRGDDFISKAIKGFFESINLTFNLKYLLFFICLLFVLKAIITLILKYIQFYALADYEEKTRNELFEKTLNSKYPYLINQKLGYLENVLMTDVTYISTLFRHIVNGIIDITGLFVYIIVALNISAKITFLTIVLGLVVFLVFKPLMSKARRLAAKNVALNKKITHFVNENIKGIKIIKASQVADQVAKLSQNYFRENKKYKISFLLYRNIPAVLMQPIMLVFVCFVFAFSFKMPNFNIAAMIAVMYLIQRIFIYIQQLQATVHMVNESYPYLNSINISRNEADDNQESHKEDKEFRFEKEIELKNLSFSYNRDKKVLDDINLKIKKGEMVGIVGSSGSGKTTIVDLLLRLFTPNNGDILVDGKNVNNVNIKSWRDNIGYITQNSFLINDSIENNIRFYDNSLSKDDLIEAAKKANIFDFITSKEEGFGYNVGESGALLSGGQIQRIAIARALAKNPRILIMDEATSSLDNKSEKEVKEVIRKLHGKITIIIIAHRLTTVVDCDNIFVLDAGRIVESGNPKKLIDNNSYFAKMYNLDSNK